MNPKLDKIKMIFIDIDGTLYNTEKQVTEYTKNVLNKIKVYIIFRGQPNQARTGPAGHP